MFHRYVYLSNKQRTEKYPSLLVLFDLKNSLYFTGRQLVNSKVVNLLVSIMQQPPTADHQAEQQPAKRCEQPKQPYKHQEPIYNWLDVKDDFWKSSQGMDKIVLPYKYANKFVA